MPDVQEKTWPRNAIDHFIFARLEQEGLGPSPEADRHALIRRASLDLTGLPPTIEEVDRFVADPSENAYERLVDELLARPTYGEHWARMWLDLARYADSSGYADDPPRTIWAFRDYVIRSLNANQPFDQFTIEQIGGDLLPNPTEDQRIATAFHRNTMTNNEGGTNDEEFRNVALVDRVNTTWAVWMGTTMACAQCHNHKYDPISQEDFFRFFALLNNTEDADRGDESPTIAIFSDEQVRLKAAWQTEIAELEQRLQTTSPELSTAQEQWERSFATDLAWQPVKPDAVKSQSGTPLSMLEDGSILAGQPAQTDTYSLDAPATVGRMTALRLEVLPHESLPNQGPGHGGGNFVVSRVSASVVPPQGSRLSGRYVRIELPGKQRILSLAEVQVFNAADNGAVRGEATQSSTAFDGPARLAIDGNTDGHYAEAKSTTHTETTDDPWWELDLKAEQPIDRIVVWNRTDNGLHTRLGGFRVMVLDHDRKPIWEQTVAEPPNPSAELALSGVRGIRLSNAFADFVQAGFNAADVLDNQGPANKGWAIGGETGKPHWLTLIPEAPVDLPGGSRLTVTIDQLSRHEHHTLGRLRLALTQDERAAEYAKTPPQILALLKMEPNSRSEAQRAELTKYYLSIAPELQAARDRLASLNKQLAEMKPYTTVPIMRELPADNQRKTQVQYRGNFLDLGPEVTAAVPAAFHPLPDGAPRDRLTLAKWLVDENNPLTPRVLANRYWEQIFGIGIVRTSEEFGSQGELPSHPELLDWLATELVAQKWDVKHLLRLMVTSAAYRQTSRVTPELLEKDPENRLLSRGPRFRLSAEMVRDQALFVSGLLSAKMYGPPVRPARPTLGLRAAFGGSTDWNTSEGEDRYRRAIYTEWRRSLPYPSMSTFDAPNREVCTLRRERTNTPLQALVTLNDRVYVEAAQALARRLAAAGGTAADKARYGYRLCVARDPSETELARLVQLHKVARERYGQNSDKALSMATKPLGAAPPGVEVVDLAAWTVVSNVLLNLDETLMKR